MKIEPAEMIVFQKDCNFMVEIYTELDIQECQCRFRLSQMNRLLG